jgi:hypothetical protein
MPILNYTTTVSANQSVQEIKKSVMRLKASAIMEEYDDKGRISHLSFRISCNGNLLFFRLPANASGVLKALEKAKADARFQKPERAHMIAWRIVKDWVEAQMAIIEANMADPVEVFLPYVQNSHGHTLYESMKSNNFKLLGKG